MFFTGFNDNSILAYLLNGETADSNMLNTTEDISGGRCIRQDLIVRSSGCLDGG